jgi:uncharacterized membrane protein
MYDVRLARSTDASQLRAYGLAALLLVIGAAHFVIPKAPDALVPAELPGNARVYTYASGIAELAVGAMLLLPSTRRRGGFAAAVLFALVFPANLNMVRLWRDKPWPMRAIALARLPLQFPLISQALEVGRNRSTKPTPARLKSTT